MKRRSLFPVPVPDLVSHPAWPGLGCVSRVAQPHHNIIGVFGQKVLCFFEPDFSLPTFA